MSVSSSSDLSIHLSYLSSRSTEHATAPKVSDTTVQGAVFESFSLVLHSKGTKSTSAPAQAVKKLHLLNLPIEIRHQIYETLIRTLRILSLSLEDASERRIGIMEPLLQTNRQLRKEIADWTTGRPHLVRNPMWGLFNPYQSQVCVRYRTDSGYPTCIFIGMPLTPEKCDKIDMLWRCMKKARTDYFRLVNAEILWEVLPDRPSGIYWRISNAPHARIDWSRPSGFYWLINNELKAKLDWYMLEPYGEYSPMPRRLPL